MMMALGTARGPTPSTGRRRPERVRSPRILRIAPSKHAARQASRRRGEHPRVGRNEVNRSATGAPESVRPMPADGTVPYEGWVTKRELAGHLKMTTRWIERQQRRGMPFLPCGTANRYNIPEVEAWIREYYRSARHLSDTPTQNDAVEARDRLVHEPAEAAPSRRVSSIPIGAAERSS